MKPLLDPKDLPEIITRKHIAMLCGLRYDKARRRMNLAQVKGEFPKSRGKKGGHFIYDRDVVLAWLEKNDIHQVLEKAFYTTEEQKQARNTWLARAREPNGIDKRTAIDFITGKYNPYRPTFKRPRGAKPPTTTVVHVEERDIFTKAEVTPYHFFEADAELSIGFGSRVWR